MPMNILNSDPCGAGPCAKVVVTAVLVPKVGKTAISATNYCWHPQEVCPRDVAGYESGQGYHLCQDVCMQDGHAEVNAICAAVEIGTVVRKGSIYVDHTWVCGSCQEWCDEMGVTPVLGKPPELVAQS